MFGLCFLAQSLADLTANKILSVPPDVIFPLTLLSPLKDRNTLLLLAIPFG